MYSFIDTAQKELYNEDRFCVENKKECLQMKYCSHCGKEIMDEAVMCPHCCCAVESTPKVNDEPNKGLNIISFLLPIVGAIMYFIYHEKEPKKAAAIGKWALYGLGFTVICYVLLTACGTAALYSFY